VPAAENARRVCPAVCVIKVGRSDTPSWGQATCPASARHAPRVPERRQRLPVAIHNHLTGLEDRTMSTTTTSAAGRTLADNAEVNAVAFSPDGQRLASGSYDHDAYVKVWDVATGELIWKARGHDKPVFAAAFSPDGQTLATGGYDKTVRLWD